MTTIINSKADLRNYVDNVLTGWTFDASIEEMADRLTSIIWWHITPDVGEDWTEYLEEQEWDELIIEADREIRAEKRTPEQTTAIYAEARELLGIDEPAAPEPTSQVDAFIRDLRDAIIDGGYYLACSFDGGIFHVTLDEDEFLVGGDGMGRNAWAVRI